MSIQKTSDRVHPSCGNQILLLLLLIGTAFLLRVLPMTMNPWPLWADELYTRDESMTTTYRNLLLWNTWHRPPLNIFFPKLAYDITGWDSALFWRSHALIFGLLSIPAVYWAALPLTTLSTNTRVLPWFAAGLACVDLSLTSFSQIARFHTLFILLSTVLLGFIIRLTLQKSPSAKLWSGFTLTFIAAIWTLELSLYFIPPVILFCLWKWFILHRNESPPLASLWFRHSLLSWLSIGLFAILPCYLFMTLSKGLPDKGSIHHSLDEVIHLLRWAFGKLFWMNFPGGTILIAVLLFSGWLTLLRKNRSLAVVFSGIVIFTLIGSYFLLQRQSIFHPRYLQGCLPLLWITLSSLVILLPWKHLGALLLSCFILRQAVLVSDIENNFNAIEHAPAYARAFRQALDKAGLHDDLEFQKSNVFIFPGHRMYYDTWRWLTGEFFPENNSSFTELKKVIDSGDTIHILFTNYNTDVNALSFKAREVFQAFNLPIPEEWHDGRWILAVVENGNVAFHAFTGDRERPLLRAVLY